MMQAVTQPNFPLPPSSMQHMSKHGWNNHGAKSQAKKLRQLLRFIHTFDVDLVSDAISIETLPSFQIAMAGDWDNM